MFAKLPYPDRYRWFEPPLTRRQHASRRGRPSHAAWRRCHRAVCAVHGGIEHEALRLPADVGGLLEPDRHPFLEGRSPGTAWRE